MRDRPWDVISQLLAAGQSCVVITVLSVRGSVPTHLGAKAVVTAAGLRAGTVGGGRVEAKAIAHALQLLAQTADSLTEVTWNLQRDIGMTCGGEMRLLFELLQPAPPWHVVLFGAGHVAQEVAWLLNRLHCRLDVIDPRSEWLQKLPSSAQLRPHQVASYTDGLPLVTPSSQVVCLTQGHATDLPVLRALLEQFPALPFLGVIGSAAKRSVLQRDLRTAGIPATHIARLICPVGLPLGNHDPAEIGLSIVAQLVQQRDLPPQPPV